MDCFAAIKGDGGAGDVFCPRCVNDCAGIVLQQLADAAGMVSMMVGDEYRLQLQLPCLQFLQCGRGVARIDDSGMLAIVQ